MCGLRMTGLCEFECVCVYYDFPPNKGFSTHPLPTFAIAMAFYDCVGVCGGVRNDNTTPFHHPSLLSAYSDSSVRV